MDKTMTAALELLERLIRAEWMISDAHSFLPANEKERQDAEEIADKAWGNALADAIAFFDLKRPPNQFGREEHEPALTPEQSRIVGRNLAEMMHDGGLVRCPTCRHVVEKKDIRR
jgi:hypothetical protein